MEKIDKRIMKYNRNYGIDLLRITLMIFIVIGHLFAHTDIRRQVTFMSNKWWFTWALQAVTVSAVDCFVIPKIVYHRILYVIGDIQSLERR